MFDTLINFLKGRSEQPAFKPLLGLTTQEVGLLKEFRDHDGYEVYMKALDRVINIQAEVILSAREDAIVHESRGQVLGLRRAASLIDEILFQEDASRRQSERVEPERPDPRDTSLYGTSAWGR